MATKPHGWATTRTGTMFHYFGLTREGSEGYRPDGSPRAMCHNALVAGTHALATAPDGERCDSCSRYLKDGLKALRQVPSKVAGATLGPGSKVTVVRGKLVGQVGEIDRADNDFPGFWWVSLHKKSGALSGPVMLGAGQLELRK